MKKVIYFKRKFLDNWQEKIQNNIFKLGDYVNSLNNENIIIGYGANKIKFIN